MLVRMRLKVNYLKHHKREIVMETQATLDKFIVTKENLAWLTPQVMEALEDSYRRGYFHGSSQCFDYFQRKKSISKLS